MSAYDPAAPLVRSVPQRRPWRTLVDTWAGATRAWRRNPTMHVSELSPYLLDDIGLTQADVGFDAHRRP